MEKKERRGRGGNMGKVRREGTNIELALQEALRRKGHAFLTNCADLPGKPDIVLPEHRIAVFCDGEFFHGKDWDTLRAQLERGVNGEYWIRKISRNMDRDRKVDQALRLRDWTVLRFWGKEILENAEECVKAMEEAIFENMMQEWR